jgi:hypothetical protein
MDIEKEIQKLESRKNEAVNKASRLNIQQKIDVLLKKKQSYENN